MPVTVQCEQCGFRYAAPDTLVGKRVRCKRCHSVFTVAAVPVGVPELNIDQDHQPSEPSLSDSDDIDAILRGAGDGEPISAAEAVRSAQPFDYPYSRHVDRFLPPLMLALSLLLIVTQTFAQDDLGRSWIPLVRLAMVLGLYAIIVFPLTFFSVKQGVRKHGSHMPWSPAWKTFSVFSAAYAVAYMLWLAGLNIASLLLGCLAGLALSLTAVWLLFRLRLDRGPEPLVYGGIGFVISVLVASGLVAGINLTVFAVTEGSHTSHEFAASPIMPGLPWEPSPPPEEPAPVTLPPLAISPDDAASPVPEDAPTAELPPNAPADVPGDGIPPQEQTTAEPVSPAPPTLTPAPSDHGDPNATASTPQPAGPTDAVAAQMPSIFDVVNESTHQPDAGEDVRSGQSSTQPPRDDTPSPSEFVRIDHPPVEPGFSRVLYPLVGDDYIAVIRHAGDDGDRIERWRTSDWTKAGEVQFRPDPQMGEQYAISPDGQRLARIVSWPTLSIQVWLFGEQRVGELVELNASLGSPSLLGFLSDGLVAVAWEQQGAWGLELVDLRQNRRGAGAVLEGVQTLHRNFAVSPDGRSFAVAARTREGPAAVLFSLPNVRPTRVLPIRLLDPRWGVEPTGLAFSAAGRSLAAYFEQDGNGLLVSWAIPGGRESKPLLFPAGTLPPRGETGEGPVFSLLGNGEAALLYGRDLIHTGTGRRLGTTAIQSTQAQHLAADGSIHIVYLGANGRTRLAVVELVDQPAEQGQ